MALQIGAKARLVQPTIEGIIVDTQYNKDSLCLCHLIKWTSESGEHHERWFVETQLEEVV